MDDGAGERQEQEVSEGERRLLLTASGPVAEKLGCEGSQGSGSLQPVFTSVTIVVLSSPSGCHEQGHWHRCLNANEYPEKHIETGRFPAQLPVHCTGLIAV